MAIESITYQEGFRIRLKWTAGVRGTVIYCVAQGEPLADADALMSAARTGGLPAFNGFSYGSGTASVNYAPARRELQAKWVDVCFCDYDEDWSPVRHERAGTFFNGMCRIGGRIDMLPIGGGRQAVQITVMNKSKFDIEANGIGYSVNGRVYGIPVALEKGKRRTLPQFDVGADDAVKLCRMEGGCPAEFYALSDS